MSTAEMVKEQARQAKKASRQLAKAETTQKNEALQVMSRLVRENAARIADANEEDCREAREKGIGQNLLNRLSLDRPKIEQRAAALDAIAALPDPVGDTDYCIRRPSGLEVKRMRVPLGLVAAVFEARPHVVVNMGGLCLKSGNASIMRGGSEALRTIRALGELWEKALQESGLPSALVQVVATAEREAVNTLITLDEYVDVLVPRGGKGLITLVQEKATVPIIKHFEGLNHVYIDEDAPREIAVRVTHNSKVFMPEVCNALENLLVHEKAAPSHLPSVAEALQADGVRLKGCPRTREILPGIEEATEEDWQTEYLDLVLAVKIVASLQEAIDFINRYSSHHTDVIVSDNYSSVKQFSREVDSGVVLANASTMFNDGGELGMGAEVGISTDKLHARGPVGLRDLTSYKYVVEGSGQIM